MGKRSNRGVLNYVLGALCIAVAVVAYTTVGAATSQSSTSNRTATVERGVVQSTVSGSGNIESSSQLDLGFKTAGTVTHIYVSQGQHVVKGQLIATLDPQSVEVSLEQAKATLQSAEASLAQDEADEGETTSASSGGSQGAEEGSTSDKTTQSAATREANLLSAKASVRSDKLALNSAEAAVQDTKLYAPESGTIVSLGGEVGETVSATGTTKAAAESSSSSSSSSTATAGAATSSAASSSSSGSSFAVLSDLSSMQLVVALSESEIGNVKVGQAATVTIEALSGKKVAAHVAKVASTSSSESGVVSYDVTFQLDQLTSGVKPGMSAAVEVVIKQAEGVNVPTSAVSGDSVTVLRDGKEVRKTVETGLAGNSTTIILSGLQAGETVELPEATTTSTSSSRSTSKATSGTLGGSSLGAAAGAGGFTGGGGPPGGGAP